ncbi:hypothetical protein Lbir_0494 [Legionella birminghamensis]|uniref:Secreted protein n=1 Tax=Legionella birminghamensis TaxID=28083 RepID=A0A378ID16_9GAMM|nr:hypothetical protein [Legionella birminghamensis]KTC75349.1 hypothetical protein Lbir_0494 [Legionella birminghamensis]STX33117.1 Uncharacterised protein [Legionella birminghamensis]
MSLPGICLLALCTSSFAFSPHCGVHTWHDIRAFEGNWKISLRMISQEGALVDSSCQPVNEFKINPAQGLRYGFGFSGDASFDIAYTITAIKEKPGFESQTCVFVVTANGPAQPDIHALAYHGAHCDWKVVPGIGEDFTVS